MRFGLRDLRKIYVATIVYCPIVAGPRRRAMDSQSVYLEPAANCALQRPISSATRASSMDLSMK